MSAQRFNVIAATFADFGWLAQKTGCAVTTDFNAIKAVDEAGTVHGMTGYCDWTQNSVRMHMAVESPIVWRSLLRPALEYPFCQVGVGMVLGVIRGGNAKSLRFSRGVGLEEIFRLKDGFRKGEDWVFLQLRKEDCRHLLGSETLWAPQHRRVA
jgi:hypothetical protein